MSTKLTEEIKECMLEIGEMRKAISMQHEYISDSQKIIKGCEGIIDGINEDITKWQSRLDAGETEKRASDVMVLPEPK